MTKSLHMNGIRFVEPDQAWDAFRQFAEGDRDMRDRAARGRARKVMTLVDGRAVLLGEARATSAR